MHNDSTNDWENLFDQLPVDSTVNSLHRESTKQQALGVLADQCTARPQPPTIQTLGHILMRYKVPHSLAAMFIVAVTFWLSQSLSQSALAFDALIENFMKVRTARYDTLVKIEGQPPLKMKGYFLEPTHMRDELEQITNIYDWTIGKQISIDSKAKLATVFNLKNIPEQLKNSSQSGNWFEGIRSMLKAAPNNPNAKVVELGEKQFDGRTLIGVRVEMPGTPLTIWADPKTQLPVRMESIMPGPPKTEVTMSNFEFDIPLDKSLFSIEVPAGYTVADINVDLSTPNEGDLVEALRMCCEVSGGEFPSGFDAFSIGKYAGTYVAAKGTKGQAAPTAQQLQEVIKIARGFQFVMLLPKDADAHYAGAGKKQGDVSAPILWYKPSSSEVYRVIYSDLSVKESQDSPGLAKAKKL